MALTDAEAGRAEAERAVARLRAELNDAQRQGRAVKARAEETEAAMARVKAANADMSTKQDSLEACPLFLPSLFCLFCFVLFWPLIIC